MVFLGKPGLFQFDMDTIHNERLLHQNMTIVVFGGATTVPGKVDNATRLNGNRQYVDIGDFKKRCLGNLDQCKYGITGSMYINFKDFQVRVLMREIIMLRIFLLWIAFINYFIVRHLFLTSFQ